MSYFAAEQPKTKGRRLLLMRAIPAALAVICLLAGCVTKAAWTRFEPFSTQRLSPKPDIAKIPMSPGEPLNRRYEKLGVVWSTWYSYEAAEMNVHKKAAEVGADAVINLRYTTYDVTVNYGTGSFINTGALTSGTVVSASYKGGYPLVAGIAVRFLGDYSDEVQFTNPNIVEPTTRR
jgi:hypothetical protein